MFCGAGGEISLAAGEPNQSVGEDVNSERVVGRHVDVDPQVKLVTADEVGLVQVPENKPCASPERWGQVGDRGGGVRLSSELLTSGQVGVSYEASDSICG